MLKKFIVTAAVEMYTETALVCLILTLNLQHQIPHGIAEYVMITFLPLNHLDDDDFQMAVHEISQNSNHSLYLGNESKLFHPFEINEDENDIWCERKQRNHFGLPVKFFIEIIFRKCFQFFHKLTLNKHLTKFFPTIIS